MRTLRRRLRAVEALLLIWLARLLRTRVPMRRWSFLLGENGPARATGPTGPTGPTGAAVPDGVEGLVGRAVGSAARRTGANCLEQAVAASLMLRVRRRPGVVVIGLDLADPGAVPHAWLVGGSGAVIVGGEVAGEFRAVNQFGRRVS